MTSSPPSWTNVSRETFSSFEAYAELLTKWNQKINIVSRETISDLWGRHIWDCYQLAEHLSQSGKVADIGSGGGLPGIILAIARPELEFHLIERDVRKCAFLTEAVRGLGLTNVVIHNEDIKKITTSFDALTARALASLDELCALANPILGRDAICLFPKGENFASEVAEAKKRWGFTHRLIPSKTHAKACIISITELKSLNLG